ncbi:MAG: hypothetical protein Q8Q09_11435 [Deltaproteobacteria bacterium]|nr:hypothetical protein [Deltaproteobacteria bacterium]
MSPRRIGPRALCCSLLAALFSPAIAQAEVSIVRYDIDANLLDESQLHVRVRLDYLASVTERKTEGFKFFGTDPLTNLSVHTAEGAPLRHTASMSAGERRVDFSLSEASLVGSLERRHAVIEFDLAPSWGYSWTGQAIHLDWAKNFRIPVSGVHFRAAAPLVNSGRGCHDESQEHDCILEAPQVLGLSVPDEAALPTNLAAFFASFVTIIASSIALRRVRLRDRLQTDGILPPASSQAYPTPIPTTDEPYRAPPPIPAASDLPSPVLPDLEAKQFASEVFGRFVIALLPLLLVTICSLVRATSIPLSLALGFATLSGIIASVVKYREKKLPKIFCSAACLVSVGLAYLGVVGIFVGGMINLFAHGLSKIDWSASSGSGGYSSSDSSYSSSSSSSCGGGGGGCGGGGGGGGCGG